MDKTSRIALGKQVSGNYNRNMKRFSHKICISLFFFTVLFIAACASGADKISYELSAAELIQLGQEAKDHNRYNTALRYFNALHDRHSNNVEMICTAEYEIGFIHYKQKKYAQARSELNRLLERYNNDPDAELLPQQFKRLANIALDSISKKEKPLFRRK